MAAHRTPFHVKRGPVVWISGLGAGSADALRTALAPWAVVRSVRILPPPKDTLPNTAVREADVEVSTMREVQELLAHADHVVLGPPSSTPVSISLSPVDRTMRVELSQHIGRLDALTWESGKRRQVLDWTLSAAADEPDWAKRLVQAVVSPFTTSFSFRTVGEQPPVASLASLAAAVDITFDSLRDALVVYSGLRGLDASLGIRFVWPKRNAFAPTALHGLDLPPPQVGTGQESLGTSLAQADALDMPPLEADVIKMQSTHQQEEPKAACETFDLATVSGGAEEGVLDHQQSRHDEEWFRSPYACRDRSGPLITNGPVGQLPSRPSRPTPLQKSATSVCEQLSRRSPPFQAEYTAENEHPDGWFLSAPSPPPSGKDNLGTASVQPNMNDRRAIHVEFWQSRRSRPIEQDAFFGQVNPPDSKPILMERQSDARSSLQSVPAKSSPDNLLVLTFNGPLADERSLRTIWVGLHGAIPGYTPSELESFFLPCGAMAEVYLPSPLRARKMYAFITFVEYRSAVAALAYTGTIFRGTQIKVRPKTVWRPLAQAPARAPSPALLPPALRLDPAPTAPPVCSEFSGAATVPPTPAKTGSPEETPHSTMTRVRSDSEPGLRLGKDAISVGTVTSEDRLPGALYVGSSSEAHAVQHVPQVPTPKATVPNLHQRSRRINAVSHTKARSYGGDWIMSPPPSAPSTLSQWPWSKTLLGAGGEGSPTLPASHLVPATAPLPREGDTKHVSPEPSEGQLLASRSGQQSDSLSPPVLVHPDGTTVLASPGEDNAGTESVNAGSPGEWTLASATTASGDESLKRAPSSVGDGPYPVLPPIPEGTVHHDAFNGATAAPGQASNPPAEGWIHPLAQDQAYYGLHPVMYPSAGAGVQPYTNLYPPPPIVMPPAGPPQPGFHFGPYGMPPASLGPPLMSGWTPSHASAAQLGASPIPPTSLPTGLGFSPIPNVTAPAYPHLPPCTFPAFQQSQPFGFSPAAHPGRFQHSGPASYGSGRTS